MSVMSASRTAPAAERRSLRATVLVAVASLSALAACGRGTPEASPPAPSSTPAFPTTADPGAPTSRVPTSSAPTSSAPTTARATVPTTTTVPAGRLSDTSRLRLDGIGPVRVGMTPAEASIAAHTTIRVTGPDIGTDCRYAQAADGPVGLAFMVVGGRIVRVDVWASPPHPGPSPVATLSGAHLGSGEDEVKALYPGRIKVTQHPYLQTGHYLVYTPQDAADRDFSLIFETDGQRVTSFRSGYARNVGQIEGCA